MDQPLKLAPLNQTGLRVQQIPFAVMRYPHINPAALSDFSITACTHAVLG